MEGEFRTYTPYQLNRAQLLGKVVSVDDWMNMVWKASNQDPQVVYFTNIVKENLEFRICEDSVHGVNKIFYSLVSDLVIDGCSELAMEILKQFQENKK